MKKRSSNNYDDLEFGSFKPSSDWNAGGSGTEETKKDFSEVDSEKDWMSFSDFTSSSGIQDFKGKGNGNGHDGIDKESVLDRLSSLIGNNRRIIFVLMAVAVVGIVFFAVTLLPGVLEFIGNGITAILSVFFSTFIIACVIWLILMMILGRKLHGKALIILFVAIWAFLLLGRLAPSFGSAIIGMAALIGILIIIYKLLIH